MKTKINENGIAHLFLLILVVVGVSSIGVYYIVKSKAAVPQTNYASSDYSFNYVESDDETELLSADLTASDGIPSGDGSDYFTVSQSNARIAARQSPAETIRVATYNILHAENHAKASNGIGDCGNISIASCSALRTGRQIEIITGKYGDLPLDIIGTQETSQTQYRQMRERLSGYNVVPTNNSRLKGRLDGTTAVWWNTKKFKKIDSGKMKGISNLGVEVTVPWVGLESRESGRQMYAISVHYPIERFGGNPEGIRRASQMTIDWVKRKAGPNTPVIVFGDFNDKLPQRLSYCEYTQNGIMQNAMDMSNGRDPSKACPTDAKAGIDQIYITPIQGLKAKNWAILPKTGLYKKSSDHTPVYSTLELNY